jgi:hypothetical protein
VWRGGRGASLRGVALRGVALRGGAFRARGVARARGGRSAGAAGVISARAG